MTKVDPSPASPAGDLISLSAGVKRTLEGLEHIRRSSHVSYEVVTAQDASKLILALLTPADRGETQAVGDGWQPISTAPKDGQLIGVAGGCAYWDVVRKCWCSAVSSDYGRPLQWEPTHWKNLDYTTLPSPSPDQNRGEPDQGGEVP